MIKPRSLFSWGFFALASWFLLVTHAHGEVISLKPATDVNGGETKYQRPEDYILDKIPFLSQVPRSFMVGREYKFDVSMNQVVIDHRVRHSGHSTARRNCMLGLSYTAPVTGFMSSRLDLPLMGAPNLHWEEWSRSSFGDYVAYLTRGTEHQSLRLVLTARF